MACEHTHTKSKSIMNLTTVTSILEYNIYDFNGVTVRYVTPEILQAN